jgi:hypothetical protein
MLPLPIPNKGKRRVESSLDFGNKLRSPGMRRDMIKKRRKAITLIRVLNLDYVNLWM